MKKRLLVLSVCAMLSVSSVLASPCACQKSKCPKNDVSKPCVENKFPERKLTAEEKKQFEAKMQAGRDAFYADLQLSAEQISKAKDLDEKSKAEIKPLMKKLRAEKIKLKELKTKKAAQLDIAKQKKVVSNIRKEIKAKMDAHKDAFEAILTCEQKTKFEQIRKEKKQKWKEFKKTQKAPKGMCPKSARPENLGTPPEAK